jgi:hypothetical protein
MNNKENLLPAKRKCNGAMDVKLSHSKFNVSNRRSSHFAEENFQKYS